MRQIILAVISLFGIFSISSSTIRQRRKEIAVRKIMGANVLPRIFMDGLHRSDCGLSLHIRGDASLAGTICLPHIYWHGFIHCLVGNCYNHGALHDIAASRSGSTAESGGSNQK